ncbi:MAG TPA: hypothetical protein PKE30_06960 [Niabella sp.]|nr:hypothetical protein [Niabella sp.]
MITLLVFFFSCQKEGFYNVYDCPTTINSDTVFLDNGLKRSYIEPYEGKSKAVFVDSLGNFEEFTISYLFSSHFPKQIASRICDIKGNDTLRLIHNWVSESYFLLLKSSTFEIDYNLVTRIKNPVPFLSNEEFIKTNELSVGLSKYYQPSSYYSVFYFDFKNDNLTSNTSYARVSQIEILGKTFRNVFYQKPKMVSIVGRDGDKYPLTIETYLNSDFGLIAFVDLSGKLWRLERLE